jgi:hypothetical protein
MYGTMHLHPVASLHSPLTRGQDELLLNRYPVSRSTKVRLDYTIWGKDILDFVPRVSITDSKVKVSLWTEKI